jgi:hypothetical protein
MGSIQFAGGYILCLLSAAAVSVYGFGFVEPAWGAGISFQVLVWLSLAGCLLATLTYASGLIMFRHSSAGWRSAFQGVLASALFLGALSIVGGKLVPVVVAVIASALIAAALAPRQGA